MRKYHKTTIILSGEVHFQYLYVLTGGLKMFPPLPYIRKYTYIHSFSGYLSVNLSVVSLVAASIIIVAKIFEKVKFNQLTHFRNDAGFP